MRVFRKPRLFVLFWLGYPCLVLLDLDRQTNQDIFPFLGASVVVLFSLFFLSMFQEGRIRQEVRSRSMGNRPDKPSGQPDHYVRNAIIMPLLFLLVLAVPLAVPGMETLRWLRLSLTHWSPFILLATLGLGVLAVALGHRRLQDALAQGTGRQEQAGMFKDPRLLTICIYLSLATMMLTQHGGTVQRIFALATLLVGIASLIQETIHHEVYIMMDHLPRKC